MSARRSSRKSRRSSRRRRGNAGVSITPNEKLVLLAIARSEYQDAATEKDLIGHSVYSKYIADDAGISGRTISGVFGSLARKGLIVTDQMTGRGDSPAGRDLVALTAEGVKVLPAEWREGRW